MKWGSCEHRAPVKGAFLKYSALCWSSMLLITSSRGDNIYSIFGACSVSRAFPWREDRLPCLPANTVLLGSGQVRPFLLHDGSMLSFLFEKLLILYCCSMAVSICQSDCRDCFVCNIPLSSAETGTRQASANIRKQTRAQPQDTSFPLEIFSQDHSSSCVLQQCRIGWILLGNFWTPFSS